MENMIFLITVFLCDGSVYRTTVNKDDSFSLDDVLVNNKVHEFPAGHLSTPDLPIGEFIKYTSLVLEGKNITRIQFDPYPVTESPYI